jgi:hypothetical protein
MSARRWFGLVVGLALLLVSSVAGANLCKEKHIEGRHRTEANVLKSETFAAGSYAGGTDYNARIIGCNRHRDSLGNDVENSIDANFAFAANLPARLIRGKINYMDAFPVRYGYELERKSSSWIVSVPLEFHFPSSNHKYKLDIPLVLANALGHSAKGTICHISQVK